MNELPQNNPPGGVEAVSKVDLLTGKHTKDLIVALLVVVILVVIAFGSLKEGVETRLLDALLALIGFFAGSKLNKE